MTIEQTVEIPADHRLTIDVPREVPAGPVVLTFSPAQGAADAEELAAYLAANSPHTVAEALQMADAKAQDPGRKPLSRHFGILSPEVFGDGVEYQRKLRAEWERSGGGNES